MHKIVVLQSILLLSISLWGQTGKVYDNLSMPNEILKCEQKYSIYLSFDYDISQRSYPVLYLLHGWSENHTA